MVRVLVVEDEVKILRGLEQGLRTAGYDVALAQSGRQALRSYSGGGIEAIILDWMLPEVDGIQVLQSLRSSGGSVPVLLLTSRDAIDDRVVGLDAGADDYLVKPFAFAELLARLRALLRRGQAERETVLRVSGLEIDLLQRRITRDAVEIPVTQREFALLEYFARHKGEAVTREMLGRDVWNDPCYALTNVIDVYINQLRKKLDIPGSRSLITTLRGIGYRMEV